MKRWNSSPHPISDIRDWSANGTLELRPDFQRRGVWSQAAQIMLIDSILRDIPIPKVFLAKELRKEKTYRIVIDGQQRIMAILAFLKDEFALDDPYEGHAKGKLYSDLSREDKDQILNYSIDFNEAVNPSDEETREVYSRVNKYTVPLSKQELRRADYPGEFLNLSEKLAIHELFDQLNFFTATNRRRYADVEYVSELISAMLEGIQDKKTTLDDFYKRFAKWDRGKVKQLENEFIASLAEIYFIFENWMPLHRTRFRNKADFYTLFLTITELIRRGGSHQKGVAPLLEGFDGKGGSIEDKNLAPLIEDLQTLDYNIRPESEVPICRDYAIKCVSQANSFSSRKWRGQFMTAILSGTYLSTPPTGVGCEVFYRLEDHFAIDQSGMCPDPWFECPICNEEFEGAGREHQLVWSKTETIFQMSNSQWAHIDCIEKSKDWITIERPDEADYIL